MSTILEEICLRKRHDLGLIDATTRQKTYSNVDRIMSDEPMPHHSLPEALLNSSTGIIAEFKRKSPSLGWIKPDLSPQDVVPGYISAGATALSILTDEPYFGGCKEFIEEMRPLVDIPILRKDFIIDEYQVFEAKQIGADAILLIAACLDMSQCRELAHRARELDMDVLLEVHNESELEYICDGVTVVGVNNRDLHVFKTDINTSLRLAELVPNEYVKISESGLKTVDDLKMLRSVGYRGFLMGERFMKQESPAAALEQFINQLEK